MIDARVQSADFDPGHQLARLGELAKAATWAFEGRLETEPEVTEIFVDHHSGLAKAELQRVAEAALARWSLGGIIVIHRHGRLTPGDRVMFAAVAATGPQQAREACSWIVDEVRRRAPFWRKDVFADGSERWR